VSTDLPREPRGHYPTGGPGGPGGNETPDESPADWQDSGTADWPGERPADWQDSGTADWPGESPADWQAGPLDEEPPTRLGDAYAEPPAGSYYDPYGYDTEEPSALVRPYTEVPSAQLEDDGPGGPYQRVSPEYPFEPYDGGAESQSGAPAEHRYLPVHVPRAAYAGAARPARGRRRPFQATAKRKWYSVLGAVALVGLLAGGGYALLPHGQPAGHTASGCVANCQPAVAGTTASPSVSATSPTPAATHPSRKPSPSPSPSATPTPAASTPKPPPPPPPPAKFTATYTLIQSQGGGGGGGDGGGGGYQFQSQLTVTQSGGSGPARWTVVLTFSPKDQVSASTGARSSNGTLTITGSGTQTVQIQGTGQTTSPTTCAFTNGNGTCK
jgi:hypothetical protein